MGFDGAAERVSGYDDEMCGGGGGSSRRIIEPVWPLGVIAYGVGGDKLAYCDVKCDVEDGEDAKFRHFSELFRCG